MRVRVLLVSLAAAALLSGCVAPGNHNAITERNAFVGFKDFSTFTQSPGGSPEEMVLTSPEIIAPISWDELIVSWNVRAGVFLSVEARAIYPDHATKFYVLGLWSDDPSRHPRQSLNGQQDSDGTVKTDTLVLAQNVRKIQLRLTLDKPDSLRRVTRKAARPDALKFLGLSFCNSHIRPMLQPPKQAAWGTILQVPERVQSGYKGPGGWCSPATVSMVLAWWSNQLHRPELDHSVPEVAAAVNDPAYGGTGNWPFNAAYAGALPGMRAYVTRFDDVSELEAWIAAGIPPILSVSSDLINDRHSGPDNGHLIVCVGFTPEGDVVANDPGVSVKRGESPRRIYPRQRVIDAWKKSKNTVYLIYPETAAIPIDRSGHWDHDSDKKS